MWIEPDRRQDAAQVLVGEDEEREGDHADAQPGEHAHDGGVEELGTLDGIGLGEQRDDEDGREDEDADHARAGLREIARGRLEIDEQKRTDEVEARAAKGDRDEQQGEHGREGLVGVKHLLLAEHIGRAQAVQQRRDDGDQHEQRVVDGLRRGTHHEEDGPREEHANGELDEHLARRAGRERSCPRRRTGNRSETAKDPALSGCARRR